MTAPTTENDSNSSNSSFILKCIAAAIIAASALALVYLLTMNSAFIGILAPALVIFCIIVAAIASPARSSLIVDTTPAFWARGPYEGVFRNANRPSQVHVRSDASFRPQATVVSGFGGAHNVSQVHVRSDAGFRPQATVVSGFGSAHNVSHSHGMGMPSTQGMYAPTCKATAVTGSHQGPSVLGSHSCHGRPS